MRTPSISINLKLKLKLDDGIYLHNIPVSSYMKSCTYKYYMYSCPINNNKKPRLHQCGYIY